MKAFKISRVERDDSCVSSKIYLGYHQDLPFMEGWKSNKVHQK